METALIELLLQGSCCFLEMLAFGTDVGAGIAGVKAQRKIKERRKAKMQRALNVPDEIKVQEEEPLSPKEHEETPLAYERTIWIFLVLFVLGVVLTGLCCWKWLR